MSRAKDIRVEPISSRDARRIIKALHYSGKVVQNSSIHFGVFLDGQCLGALSFGPSMDKRRLLGLVRGTEWHQFIELNRMALSDALPRNSESRAISIALRMLRKGAPQLKWVISYADGAQCGDGTIYRASGFVLTGITRTHDLIRLPSGEVIHHLSLKSSPMQPRPELGGRTYFDVTSGGCNLRPYLEASGGVALAGHQFRYVYFLDRTWRSRLTAPEIPFSEIPEDARMYRGENRARSSAVERPAYQQGGGRFES